MSSILTNSSAMVALQTMKSISMNLAQTTSQISTGKRVATAKDNAAVWAISKVMESDVQGFQGISDSLSLGSSTIAVAGQASATVTDLLTQMKGKIVAAQESNVDRTKIQADIVTLKNQISSVVGAAQFNGLNLVNNSNSVDILSSLDRSGGSVTASSITVTGQDLSIGAYAAKAALTGSDGASTGADTAGFTLDASTGTGKIVIDNSTPLVAGDSISIAIGGKSASYTVTADDAAATAPADIVAVGLKKAIESLGISGLSVDYSSSNAGELDFTNGGSNDLTVAAQFKNAGAGGLGALSSIDVSTGPGATAALGNIETMLQTAINASAAFGSVQSQVDTQKTFVGNLIDSMKTGIGSLVDANMEEASARLQALQVQQQLSTQALSIANQQPQSLLSLFR
ncbi:flagellin [bacterium]|nr:flagellin [bacterium]